MLALRAPRPDAALSAAWKFNRVSDTPSFLFLPQNVARKGSSPARSVGLFLPRDTPLQRNSRRCPRRSTRNIQGVVFFSPCFCEPMGDVAALFLGFDSLAALPLDAVFLGAWSFPPWESLVFCGMLFPGFPSRIISTGKAQFIQQNRLSSVRKMASAGRTCTSSCLAPTLPRPSGQRTDAPRIFRNCVPKRLVEERRSPDCRDGARGKGSGKFSGDGCHD